jgi:hypothetical protein
MPTYDTTDPNGLRALTGSNVGSDIDAGFKALRDDISAKFAPYSAGPLGSRPPSTTGSPGIAGRRYRATDTKQEFIDTGTSWVQVALNESAAAQVAAAEGTSSSSMTDLTTTGPSVTVTVPDLGGGIGVVQAFAQATVANPGTGHGRVALYEDATSKSTILDSTAGATATFATLPGSNAGDNIGLAGVPLGTFVTFLTTPGAHTYKLRYSINGSGAATFSARTLIIRALG